ncbi:GMC oxidoreductase [Streptomyces diastatochromogenes]|nr:GMC oxidoreductase [Streptomyces diastatochromogenes]
MLQSVGVEEHHAQGVLIEATATPPGMGSFILPGLGTELRRELETADRLATLGAMIADRPSGRVLGRDRTLIRYDLDPATQDACYGPCAPWASCCSPPVPRKCSPASPYTRVRSLTELDAALAGTSARHLHLSAYHPTGTVAAGADPHRFPADPWGRLRGVHGVLLADASVLPSCPQVNPQLGIMAAALAITETAVRA